MSEFKVRRNGNPMRGADLGTEKSVLMTVMAVTAQAKALCPVDKGHLRNSIMWKVQKAKGGGSGKEIDVSDLPNGRYTIKFDKDYNQIEYFTKI